MDSYSTNQLRTDTLLNNLLATFYTSKQFSLHFPTRYVCSKNITIHLSSYSQAHGSVELSSFCESYFLQQMPALLEKEGFKALLLGPPGARQGNISTSTLAHCQGDSPVEELEATLAQRLRSLHVTSRV